MGTKGIRADRADHDDLTTRVYSIDPWLQKQEFGEAYKPSGYVAIPKGARPSPGPVQVFQFEDGYVGDF